MTNSSSGLALGRRGLLSAAAGAGAGVAGLALVGCGSGTSASNATTAGNGSTISPATSAAGARKGGRITVGATVDMLPLNPPYQLNATTLIGQAAIYDNLFRYDSLSLQPVPRLGASYEFNPDQTQLTVALRPNLQFHNGKPIDAQAVVDSFNSLSAKGTPPNQPSGVARAYVDSAQASDATHVTFKLKRPGMVVFDLFHFWNIADATTIADLQKGALPNGSGPFRVTAVHPKEGGTLDAFTQFWQPPLLDGIDYKVYPDAASLAIAVQAGSIHLTKDLSIDDALRLGKQSGYHATTDKGLSADFSIGANTKGDVMKDPRLRKALYHLVDRKNVINTAFLGQSTALNGLWPKGSPAYESRYDQDPFDIQKAKQLLQAAGYANGTPPIEIITPSNQKIAPQIVQIIQASARQAGFNLTIKELEQSVFTGAFQKVSYSGCYFNGFGFNQVHPDSLPVMNYQMRVPNSCHYDSAEFESILGRLVSANSDNARQPVYAAFNQLWDNEMWAFLICSQTFQWLTTTKVRGFAINDFSAPLLETVSLA